MAARSNVWISKGIVPGFCAQLIIARNPLSFDEEGYLGPTFPGVGYAEIKITIEPGYEMYPFSVHGWAKTINSLPLQSPGVFTGGLTVGVNGPPEHPDNSVRILEVENEYITLWEVALVVQPAGWFFTCQPNGETCCYQGRPGQVLCPFFKRWPAMEDFLQDKLGGRSSLLPSIATAPQASLSRWNIPSGKGWVKWYNFARGFGKLIVCEKGRARDVLVRCPAIVPRKTLRFLLPGMEVPYEQLIQLPKARHGFHWEALSVYG